MENKEMHSGTPVSSNIEVDYKDLEPILFGENKQEYKPVIPEKRKMARQRKIFIISMLAYPILHFLIFWVYINFNTVIKSFQGFSFRTGDEVYVGMRNYLNFFKAFASESGQLKHAVINSLLFFVFNNFILLPISIVCAYLLFKKVFMEKVFRIIFFLPNIISVVVLTMVFKFMFDNTFGPLYSVMDKIGFNLPENGFFGTEGTAMVMIFVYCLWAGIGYNVLLLSGTIARIPTEVFEAGKIDGIGMFREFIQIVVPLIFSTVSTLFVTGSMVMFTLFLQPMLLTKGGPNNSTYTLAYYIVEQVNNNRLYDAAAAGVICSIVGIPIIQGIKYIMEKLIPNVEF